jgi:uncharacterized protein YbbC (DUF1343 family)/CubicO group peptidase (beta-lactamase class C family)
MRRLHRARCTLLVLACFISSCTKMPPADPPPAFSAPKLEEIDRAVEAEIQEARIPGGVLWIERNGAIFQKAYGHKALLPEREPATPDTIFDAASLTKVIATTPAILLLVERGKLQLDAAVATYIPEFKANGKEAVTVRQLLTHTSGLRPGLSPSPAWNGQAKAIELACSEKLLNAPGTVFRYSDINFILLGELVERASGQRLDEFCAAEIYRPLKMSDTSFLPPLEKRSRIAPTEFMEGEMMHGKVHDPTARRMGGVAGHAGLFTTAHDLARFSRMLLNEGALEGARIMQAETVQLMARVQTSDAIPTRRGLGWDIDSGYSRPRGKHFPLGSYGHAGWTGTCLWIDPFSKTFWIFLSNRVHPDGKGNVLPLQATLASLAAESILGFNFAGVAGALPARPVPVAPPAKPGRAPNSVRVLNGIDVLARDGFKTLRGMRVGLITNHTGTDQNRNPTIDLIHQVQDVTLLCLFSPEHGIRGQYDEKVSDSRDEKTGLPIYSLYGETRTPKPEQLKDLDALVFDIQDIGCRFYTYISTMGNGMEAAGKAGLKFIVLDRVNPINGVTVEGPVLNAETSFVAFHPIPVRHGMTVGELARMFNAERHFQADLTVVPIEGWSRGMWFDETVLPWINPSPNMRSLTAATLYPGIGLLEMNPLSVGRGTGTPFELIGAPYIDDLKLAGELNQLALQGVRFVPIRFTPNASVFKDQPCAGISIVLTDRAACNVVEVGISIAQTLHRLYPKEFNLERFDRLMGHKATLKAIAAGRSLEEIRQIWSVDGDEFLKRRAPFLIYQ